MMGLRMAVVLASAVWFMSKPAPKSVQYAKSLRYNSFAFSLTTPDTGAVRDLTVQASRNGSLLTIFHVRIDGAVAGAEVADLDNNRSPELYVYSTSDGSGSFGRVYGWQFLPERRATIDLLNWKLPSGEYMGHDSLWVEQTILCRRYPAYRPGDANAEPSGGVKMMRYRLQPAGTKFQLVAE